MSRRLGRCGCIEASKGHSGATRDARRTLRRLRALLVAPLNGVPGLIGLIKAHNVGALRKASRPGAGGEPAPGRDELGELRACPRYQSDTAHCNEK